MLKYLVGLDIHLIFVQNLKPIIMKTVHELSQEELEELRSRWYHQHLDDGSLNEVMDIDEEIEIIEEDIPIDIVKSYYEDTYFVEEDFFCNIKN